MGWACSKHGRSEIFIETLIGRGERKKKHLEDVEVDGRVILKRMLDWVSEYGLDSCDLG
jgi:hypothetical protein